jgi:hypothetical protein
MSSLLRGRTGSINFCQVVGGTVRSCVTVAGTQVSSQRFKKRWKDTWAINVDLTSHLSPHVLPTLLQSVGRTWGFRVDAMNAPVLTTFKTSVKGTGALILLRQRPVWTPVSYCFFSTSRLYCLQELKKIECKKRRRKIRNLKHLAKKISNLAFHLYRYSLRGRIRNGRVAHLLVWLPY